MKTLITGDLHNKFNSLNKVVNHKKPDNIICCGDFGYWPKFERMSGGTHPLSSIKLQGAEWLRWCDGNHEDFWSLAQREKDEIEPGIIYQPRGSTYTLPDGRTILFMGGAHSIDKHVRKIGIDWFPEEVISYSDFENLPECDVDIFITHTCPVELVDDLRKDYPEKGMEPSNHALTEMWKIYKPDLWFFGHWHQYYENKTNGTQFYGLSAPGYPGRWWMWLPERREKE
jgi:predicted phosphodiesterase